MTSDAEVRHSYPKAKFPKPWLDDHWYYAHDDVLDWFKRCLDDLPDGSYKLAVFNLKMTQWLNKWFSQFKNWEEFDWDKALEVQSSPTRTRDQDE